MAKKIEVWYSANNSYEKEAIHHGDVGTYSETISTGFSPIHEFSTPKQVYEHFLESKDIANGGMYYIFWEVRPDLPRKSWKKAELTMDNLRNAKDTKKLIGSMWK